MSLLDRTHSGQGRFATVQVGGPARENLAVEDTGKMQEFSAGPRQKLGENRPAFSENVRILELPGTFPRPNP
jgi:hypothetical protein